MPVFNRNDIIALANRLELKISHFARGSFPVSCNNEPTSYSVNRLLYVVKNSNGDENYIKDEHGKYVLRPGYFYLVPSFHPAIYVLDDELIFVSVHFRMEYFSGNDFLSRLHSCVIGHDEETTLFLNESFNSSERLFLSLKLHDIVTKIILECIEDAVGVLDEMEERFAQWQNIIEYINMHCNATVTVDSLAGIAGMSRGAFTRKFSQTTGVTPKKFFHRRLAKKAADMLFQPNITVREVSQKLKFSSEYAFSRFFKKHFGSSPDAYRNKNRL